MKLKDKMKLIDTILEAMVKDLPPEDSFWTKSFRDTVVDREEAVFALFNKAVQLQSSQS